MDAMNPSLFLDAPRAFRLADAGLPSALLLTPRGFEPNYRYPLLALLHDDGRDETQWQGLLPQISDRNYLAVALRAPQTAGDGYAWGAGLGDASAVAARIAATFPVHAGRIFAVGVGAGGGAAIRAALAQPDLFAGAAAFNPRGGVGDLGSACRRRTARRFFVTHGRTAPHAEESRALANLLHAAGQPVVHLAYPGPAATTAGMLRAANRWSVFSTPTPPSRGLRFASGRRGGT
jgi:phospholipase/carboxylesterase